MFKTRRLLIVSVFSLLLALFIGKSCFAVNTSDVARKWVFTGYQKCIADGQMNTTLATTDHKDGSVANDVFQNGGTVTLPSYGFGGVGEGSGNCRSLFLGDGVFSGGANVLAMSGLSDSVNWDNASDARNFLEGKIGYTYKASGGQHLVINATRQRCEQGSNDRCTEEGINSVRIYKEGNNKYRVETGFLNSGQWIREIEVGANDYDGKMKISIKNINNCAWGNSKHEFEISYDDDIEVFASKIGNAVFGVVPICTVKNKGAVVATYKYGFSRDNTASVGEDGTYTFNRNNKATVEKSIKSLSGLSASDLSLNENERYALYLHYLNSAVKEVDGTIDCSSADDPGLNFVKVRLKKANDFGDCYVSFNGKDSASISVNDLVSQGSGQFPRFKVISMKDVIDWFNTVDISKLDNVDVINDYDPLNPSSEGDDSCLAADLNGQGWWLCSTMENLRYTANPMDNMIDSMLTTDTDLYNYDSPTHSVWEIMRNIANIFMIIFLLVIIISQITGYGISNYGIKKMLPRFIVIAILINLSFVISSVAVDLSNLLGVGLRNLFGGIGSSLNSTGGVRDFIDAMVGGLLASVGLVGGSAATIITIIAVFDADSKIMLIVLIVLALLVVVVAIGIFLAMLGARAIIIIGCVAISPVAFALYVLPNTQNIFKKWWSLFKAALVIYPICGAVGGISYLIKAVIYGSKGFHPLMGIVVLISPYLVFFMLPTLLKGAITALGSVGAALTQAGESFKRGIAKSSEAIQNTERFKAGMSEVNRSRNLGTANKTIGQLKEKQKSGIPLTPFEKRRLAAAGQTVDKLKAEDRAANTAIAMMDLKDQDLDYANGQLTDAIMSGDTDRIEAVSSAMFSLHGTQAVDSIAAVLDNLEVKNGEIEGITIKNNEGKVVGRVSAENAAMALSAFRDLQVHDSNSSGIIRSKASDAWQMIANRGYGADGEMHDLEWHSAHNGIATQDADWASQNSTTLKRSKDAAKKYTDLGDKTVSGLTKERAESLLNSSDNNIKSTILSEAGKVDILEKVVNPSGGTAENVVTQAVSASNGGGGSNNGTIVIRDGGNNGGGDNSNLAQEMRQVERAIDSMSDQIQAGAAEVSSSIRNNSGAPSGTPQTVTNSGNGKVISTRGYTDDSGVHHREKKMSNGEVIDEVG